MTEEKAKREAEQIWDKLIAFSSYGFNKSHSAAYGLMSYYCAFFKAHYPEEFYTASLNFSTSEFEVISILDEIDSRKLRLKVYPPDINKSNIYFYTDIKNSSIYWSLVKIKGLGDATVTKIMSERKNGDFRSASDFVKRMKGTGVGVGVAKELTIAGAFDITNNVEEPKDRKRILDSLCNTNKDFEILARTYPKEHFSKNYAWTYEQKAITGFGRVDYKGLLRSLDKKLSSLYLKPEEFLEIDAKNLKSCIAGRIIGYTEKDSKRGKFGILTVECNNKMLTSVIWSDVWEEQKEYIEKSKKNNNLVVIVGRTNLDNWRGHNVLYSDKEITKIITL